jgi:hypothetical protein
VCNTVGRGGNFGLIWHGANGTQRLGGLGVGLDLAAGIGVDAGVVLVVTITRDESAVLDVAGGVVETSDTIVNMLAELSSVGARRIADLEAEEVATEEARMEA